MSRIGGTWIAAAAGAVLLGISFYALITWLEHGQLSDVGGYQQHATAIRAGQVPYRDFPFEYPPAALPPMLLPAYMSWSYATSFAVLMGVCGAACIAAAASALKDANDAVAGLPSDVIAKLREIVRNTENVGRRFPEEARKIHYNEVPARSIRGQASRDEAQELSDEGIDFAPLPPFLSSDPH